MKKTKTEKALDRALDDACKTGLPASEQKLITVRIQTLAALVEREHDATVERLTGELERLTAELASAPSATAETVELREIKDLVRKNRAS